jgi:cyclopropane-fatty-acyl-phospholipid synthase
MSPAEVIAGLLKDHAGAELRLRAWDGSEAGPPGAPVVVLRSPQALQRILWRPGELGLARAYISGDLDIEGDLTDGLRRVWGTLRDAPARGLALAPAAVAAVKAVAQLKLLGPPPPPPAAELRVRGRLHSRARDQAVIAGHYDLTAAFYQLILDPSMAYSCAYWDGPEQTLAEAQHAKLELIGRKLALEPGQTLLDMGCGWGSLTIHAATAGIRVTGVTLSREQGGYVRQRARGLGLAPDVLIQDAGFEVTGVEAMREHYVRTIRAWLASFEHNLPAITAVLSPEQVRVWRLYLAGGALAFEEGRMGVDQILARRPQR